MVLGADTERGNVLKDSGITLHEDSTMINERDEARIPLSGIQHEIFHH